MRWPLALLCAVPALFAQTACSAQTSADLLFLKSNSTAALRRSAEELKLNPHDLDALFVRMEAARIELRSNEELRSAVAILKGCPSADPRARIAADRVRELAANTPVFRSAEPQLAELLRKGTPFSVELSDAFLKAADDGVVLPRRVHLARRIKKWQLAGPFGRFTNVDFDRSWAPEHDNLMQVHYGNRVVEVAKNQTGELELPDYFPRSGIYYAAADVAIEKPGAYQLTIESEGTFEVLLEGQRLVLHNARFHTQKKTSRLVTQLSGGNHRLTVKLQSSAFPLRIWISPALENQPVSPSFPDAERAYMNAASSLLDGDSLPARSLKGSGSAISRLLSVEALSQSGDEQQMKTLLEDVLTKDPAAQRANLELAKQEFNAEKLDDAATRLGKVLKAVPDNWTAQELKYQLAANFDWQPEQQQALLQRLRLHPDCGALAEAANFYEARGDRATMTRYESKLAACSPTPFPFWDRLSQHGEHGRAAADIARYLRIRSRDRRALTKGIREAVLAGDEPVARRYAESFAKLAPNCPWAEAVAKNPKAILDSRSARIADDFYLPFVRDSHPMMSGGDAQGQANVVLINDRVMKLEPDGGAWIYQHAVTQVFDKKGIEQAGEVELPRAADVLQLRTLKADGTSVEPEAIDGKNTVSLPSLAPSDAVEVAWLQHFDEEALAANPELLDFHLGSSDSPTRSARLTIIREREPEPLLWHSPNVHCSQSQNRAFMSCEAQNLAPPVQEPAEPTYEKRARVRWLSSDLRTHYREQLIEATQVTGRIEEIAAGIQGLQPRARIASAYEYVTTAIEKESGKWPGENNVSADDSFAEGEGNRATALIALLSAMGFDSDLELAAERGGHDPAEGCADLRCYVHPLIRVALPHSTEHILLDPDADDLSAAALSPEVEGEPAVIVSRLHAVSDEITRVPRITEQRSSASADLYLTESGGMQGTIHVRFGSLRGAQMRAALSQLSASDRQAYFEEIADRILANAAEVAASLIHEQDVNQPLELILKVSTPKVAHWNGSDLDLGELIPALGLARMYATLPARETDLLVEAPLIESSEFVVHLPAGIEVSRLPQSAEIKSGFGEYHTEFQAQTKTLTIQRSFRIPAQEVSSSDYPAFSSFAFAIDAAERQSIQLRRTAVASYPVPETQHAASLPRN